MCYGLLITYLVEYILTRTFFILQNTDYALLVLLPKTKDNLDDVLNKLSENSISELTKSMSMKPAFVTMPCFQSSNITNLKTVLQQVCTYFIYARPLIGINVKHIWSIRL